MRRPVIGITGSHRRGRPMWWFSRVAVLATGGVARRITPLSPVSAEKLDGLIVGGGDDIDAELYRGEVVLSARIDPARDALELTLLEAAHAHGLPVLGICRGAQMMNVARGGDLHQDVTQAYGIPRYRRQLFPRKRIEIMPRSALSRIIGGSSLRVNALHHQAISQLGHGLVVSARDRHGIVQAVEDPANRFFLGVQWHPEFLTLGRAQRSLFRALVRAARERVGRAP